MKKALAGLVIATLFFFVGRNQPAIVVTKSHDGKNNGKHDVKTASPTADLAAATAAKQNPSNLLATEQASQQNAEETQILLTFKERLATLQDSELFETLYSNEFKTQWQAALPTLKQRLFSALPKLDDPTNFEKEATARLGILKALDIKETENNEELKEFLFEYIEFAAAAEAKQATSKTPQLWLLQREAAHTLSQNNDLNEEEQNRLAINLDPKARNTATKKDAELIERTLAGDE